MIITDSTLLDIKSAIEEKFGCHCSVRQQLLYPYRFEIEFDPEEK